MKSETLERRVEFLELALAYKGGGETPEADAPIALRPTMAATENAELRAEVDRLRRRERELLARDVDGEKAVQIDMLTLWLRTLVVCIEGKGNAAVSDDRLRLVVEIATAARLDAARYRKIRGGILADEGIADEAVGA